MEEMVQKGIVMGLDEICFTNHVDYGIKLDWDTNEGECRIENGELVRNVDYPAFFEKIARLQKKMKEKHKKINDDYYQELYDVISAYQGYSVLGHMDLIKRYDPYGVYPFENNKEIVYKQICTFENMKPIFHPLN